MKKLILISTLLISFAAFAQNDTQDTKPQVTTDPLATTQNITTQRIVNVADSIKYSNLKDWQIVELEKKAIDAAKPQLLMMNQAVELMKLLIIWGATVAIVFLVVRYYDRARKDYYNALRDGIVPQKNTISNKLSFSIDENSRLNKKFRRGIFLTAIGLAATIICLTPYGDDDWMFVSVLILFIGLGMVFLNRSSGKNALPVKEEPEQDQTN